MAATVQEEPWPWDDFTAGLCQAQQQQSGRKQLLPSAQRQRTRVSLLQKQKCMVTQ